MIKDKQLLIVPSGALTQVPFQVLVTQPPDLALAGVAAMRHATWLIRSHAITVLPAVSSLKALRRDARPSRASLPMIGFGNPLLGGDPADRDRAALARANTTCPVEVASISVDGRGVAPFDLHNGLANVAQIRQAPPLPETADELCAVAKDLNVAADNIYLGARATVPEVQHLSETGALAMYHLIHFATHGALSGQIKGTAEPGLILTPPVEATETDDGYLSASRIATLKLDADWVILSACNTAAGESKTADALSGSPAPSFTPVRAVCWSHIGR